VIFGLLFYYYLGNLAAELNKSSIVWVGLTFICGPFGAVYAYFKMKTFSIENGWV
jgi:hypothetical protein